MANELYMPLSTLVDTSAIPKELEFLQQGINNILSKLYYRDLQFSQSRFKDGTFYSLTLITYAPLEIDIPGTEMSITFQPDINVSPSQTAIPLKLSYEWKILRFIDGFRIENFADNGAAFFNLLTRSLGISVEELVEQAIEEFSAGTTINDFVDDLNNYFATSIIYPIGADFKTQLAEVRAQIEPLLNAPVEILIFSMYLFDSNSDDSTKDKIDKLFQIFLDGQTPLEFARSLLIPKINMSMQLGAGLKFPREYLVPLDATLGPNYGQPIPGNVVLSMDAGTFFYSTEKGIGFEENLVANLPFCGIGNTGLRLQVSQAKLDFSRKSNIPEATADGRPDDFVGVFCEQAAIEFPKFWQQDTGAPSSTAAIVGRNLLIGTGGLSGTIGLEATNGGDLFHTRLGSQNGFEISLSSCNITFKQNQIVDSNIRGTLKIPGFEDASNPGNPLEVDVLVHIGDDGFEVTAVAPAGLKIRIPGVLDFTINSLSIGRTEDPNDPGNYRFFMSLSGGLEFTAPAPGGGGPFLPGSIDVKRLTIYDDGTFEFVGGVTILPKSLSLKVGPAELSVTAIHFGSHEQGNRKYVYFGFDGGVDVNPGGVDARGDGIKFYFSVDNQPLHIFFRINGIGIDLMIPGNATKETAAVLISGYLAMRNPDPNPAAATDPREAEPDVEYMGGVTFGIPKAKIAGSAGMRMRPSVPAFLVDLGLELPVPIPLGPTGLGIYGFRGLIGQHYVPTKQAANPNFTDSNSWWEYYKEKTPPPNKEGINIAKFDADKDGFSLGAGISLATAGDSGKVFSSKLFFLLGLPDVFLLQGQAAILSERVGLDTSIDPPFSALIAISSSSVEANFGVNYKLPKPDGKILRLDALLELGFFFQNSSAWYVNFGRDTPENKRVQARILDLFNGYSYLMLSSTGIKAGAGVSWEFEKKFGPVALELGASMDVGGQISWGPPRQPAPRPKPQIGGFIMLAGYARIRVFRFGLGFSVSASLAAEAPKPFIVTGKFNLTINLPWPFSDINLSVELTWNRDPNPDLSEILFMNVLDMASAPSVQALNMMSKEPFPLNWQDISHTSSATIHPPTHNAWNNSFDNYIIPMDSRIDIEFSKPVKPAPGRFGGVTTGYNFSELVPPKKGKSDQLEHQYEVEEILIKCWNPNTSNWEDYDIYDAATPATAVAGSTPANLGFAQFGYWQLSEPKKYTKLMLLAQTQFEYLTAGSPGQVITEQWGFGGADILCALEDVAPGCSQWVELDGGNPTNHNWDTWTAGTIIPGNTMYHDRIAKFHITGGGDGVIRQDTFSAWGIHKGLEIATGQTLEIIFDEPVSYLNVKFHTTDQSSNVIIREYAWLEVNGVAQHVLQATHAEANFRHGCYGVVTLNNPCSKIEIENLANPATSTHATYMTDLEVHLINKVSTFQATLTNFQNSYAAADQACQTALLNGDPNAALYCYQALLMAAAVSLATDALAAAQAQLAEVQNPLNHPNATGTITPAGFILFELGFMTATDYAFHSTLPSQAVVNAQTFAQIQALNHVVQPIWRPNTNYAVQMKTKNRVQLGVATPTDNTRYYTFGFRTSGPIGHFHKYADGANTVTRADYLALENRKREEEYKLASLQHYIDFDTSYPNPDGNVIGSKPVFYEQARMKLFFLYQYVYAMFSDWDAYAGNSAESSSLEVLIKDPRDVPYQTGSSSPSGSVGWQSNTANPVPQSVTILNNLLASSVNCTGYVGPVIPPGLNAGVDPTGLEPLKLYQAIWNADFNGVVREVHRYNFQTSGYPDFKTQVESYILDDGNGNTQDAVFNIELALPATDLALVSGILGGSTGAPYDQLQSEFMNRFDRLVDGVFKIGALEVPVGTEFNVLANTDQGNRVVFGVLVRNPEPFNDPRLPDSILNDTLKVVNGSGAALTGFSYVFSKDRSQILILHDAQNLATGSLNVRFKYYEFDGSNFSVPDAQLDDITVTISIS